jgi:hypothetical protein
MHSTGQPSWAAAYDGNIEDLRPTYLARRRRSPTDLYVQAKTGRNVGSSATTAYIGNLKRYLARALS